MTGARYSISHAQLVPIWGLFLPRRACILSQTRFRGFGVADESARCSPARSGGYNDFGTSVLRYFGHCRAADSRCAQPGPLKLRLPKLSFPARQRPKRLTVNPLQRKRSALAPPSCRAQNSRPLSSSSLNVRPLKLSPLALAAALAASGAGLSAVA